MVREYEFKIGLDSISPAGKQIVGMQGEVKATTIRFIVDEVVRNKMNVGYLKYRFEAIDSLGNVEFGELKDLSWEAGDEKYRTFEYIISEAMAKNGGNAEVYLIIACFDDSGENQYEWRSRPARFTFVDVENSGNAMDEERESLSALSQQALIAAQNAENVRDKIALKLENGDFKGEKGDQGEQGPQGPQGEQGIQGEKGETGNSGVYVGPEEPEDENINVWVDPEGEINLLSVQITETESGHTITIEDQNGLQSFEVLNGEDGAQGLKGDKGDTGEQGIQGIQGIQGEKGEKGDSYILTETDKAEIAELSKSDIPDYWKTDLEEGVEAINTALCEAGQNKSAFLFYTDAHYEWSTKIAPKLLKYLYEHTGMTKTNYGGDIVSVEGEDYDIMAYLWDWRNQLKGLLNHHSVVGNHDDGNTTNNLFSEQYVYGFLLAAEETQDITPNTNGDMYYYVDNPSERTRYIYLDTAYKGVTDNQKEFVNNALLTTPDNWHIVPVAHIWYDPDYDQYDVRPIPIKGLNYGASLLCDMFDNYNGRIDEFSNCGAKVEFCIGGHVHMDYVGSTGGGIPIIIVETAGSGTRGNFTFESGTTTESAVSGIIADYNAGLVKVIRIGRGNSFDVDLKSNETVTYYSITNNLSGVTSSSETTSVKQGETFETMLSASTEGEMTVVITMGDTDLTDSAYDADTGVISIVEVTGNIVIKAIVKTSDASYTNVLVSAIDTDGSVYNEVGYKQNMRWSSSSNDFKDADGNNWDVTGYIAVKLGDILRLKNITWQDGDYSRMNIYNANFERFSEAIYSSIISKTNYETVLDDNGNIIQLTIPNWSDFADIAYIRIGCQDLDETSIITINEPIE